MKKKSILGFLLIFFISGFCHPVYSQVVIASDDFEGTTIFNPSGTGFAFLTGLSLSPTVPILERYFETGSSGFGVTNGTTTLLSNDINTISFTNITLQLKLAAFAVNGTAGLDVTDRVRVAVSNDGGLTYTDIVLVTGASSSNSWWSYNGSGVASGIYPTPAIYNATSSGLNINGFSNITITNLPAISNLRIRIALNNNSNERWVIDQFIISGIPSILPLKLTSFNGSQTKTANHLKWKTEQEINTKKFIVEKSKDGVNFIGIATLASNGNSTGNYQYDDLDTQPGKIYYRLKMVDNDGQYTYSGVIVLSVYKDGAVSVYPNPVKDYSTININSSLLSTTAILTDVMGKQLQRISLIQTATSISLAAYPAGIYMLQLQNGETIKLIKQ